MRSTSGNDWIWAPTRHAIYARDGFACLVCKSKGPLSLDHVKPGKDNRPANLVTLCVSCNSSKRDRPLGTWRPDLVDLFALACASPIDRALGRALCEQIRPGRLASQLGRATRRRDRLARLPTSAEVNDGSPPPF